MHVHQASFGSIWVFSYVFNLSHIFCLARFLMADRLPDDQLSGYPLDLPGSPSLQDLCLNLPDLRLCLVRIFGQHIIFD